MQRSTLFCPFVLAVLAVACGEPVGASSEELTTELGSELKAGVAQKLRLEMKDDQGNPLTAFDPLHGADIHLLAVSSDLEQFLHLHPRLAAPGVAETPITVKRQTPYHLYMEYDPAGASAGPRVERRSLSPEGAAVRRPCSPLPGAPNYSRTCAPLFFQPVDRTDEVRVSTTEIPETGEVVELLQEIAVTTPRWLNNHSRGIEAGELKRLVFDIKVPELERWLGMPAHLVVLNVDDPTYFQHLHAFGVRELQFCIPWNDARNCLVQKCGTETSNQLAVDVSFPRPGLYKVFLQFAPRTYSGTHRPLVVTAPFHVQVRPATGRPNQKPLPLACDPAESSGGGHGGGHGPH